MKKLIAGIIVILIVYIAYMLGYSIGGAQNTPKQDTTQVPLITEINDIRKANKVKPLAADPTLDKTAQIKADDMAKRNYFSHNTPEGTPWSDFIYENRPGSVNFAENIAECYPTNHDTIIGWVNSPKHYENIVSERWTKYGTATVWDDDRSCFVTVNHFAGDQ